MDDSEEIVFEYFTIGSGRSFEEFWDIVEGVEDEPIEESDSISFDPVGVYLTLSEDDEFRRRVLVLKLGDGLTWNPEDKSVHIVVPNSRLRFIREDATLMLNFWIETPTGEIDSIIKNRAVQAVRVG